MIEVIGYIFAVIIGLILGLMGGGGSIITVPVLVYIMALNPVTATAYSLFIVGTTSAFGTIQNLKNKLVDIKTSLMFALPSLVGVYLSRKYVIPAIPETLLTVGEFELHKGMFLMVLFAIVMLLAAKSMLKTRAEEDILQTKPEATSTEIAISLFQVFLIGILVGLIGAGGGFLFIPMLVFITKLPMKTAVATSLFIIAINSLIGFIGDIGSTEIDWPFLLKFSFFSIIGIFLGIYLNKFINEKQLKKGFGYFVLLMSVVIFVKELFL